MMFDVEIEAPDGQAGDRMRVDAAAAAEAGQKALEWHRAQGGPEGWLVVTTTEVRS